LDAIFDKGVYLPELDLWLDSLRKKEICIVSHAHSDHVARHKHPILTKESALFLNDYYKKCDPLINAYYETVNYGHYTTTFYPAGHCLGSAQTLIQSLATGEKILYTGDFKTREHPINKPFEPVECDTLIIEATYGHPEYTFPDQENILHKAISVTRDWLSQGKRPVIYAWKLGKAQELIHHFQSHGIKVLVEKTIYDITMKYVESGIIFPDNIQLMNDSTWPEGSIVICPPSRRNSSALDKFSNKRFMELTGWSISDRRRWGCKSDVSLPYSDHADFNELVGLVNLLRPKITYTINGFPNLAAHLRKLGHASIHLENDSTSRSVGYQFKLM
jgi:Cft2 family RNA processing exonuclease